MLNSGLLNTIQGRDRSIGETTIDVQASIKIKGQPDVVMARRFTGATGAAFAAASPAVPLSALLNARMAGVDVSGVKVELTVAEGSKSAALDGIVLDKSEVRAGDTVNVTATLRRQDGTPFTTRFPLTIPSNAMPGKLNLTIADGNTTQQASAMQQFAPRTPAELISTLNDLKRSDQLYAVFSRAATGAVIGASEMPDLPPSMLATLRNDRSSGGVKSTTVSILGEKMLSLGDLVFSGSQSITLEVVK
jgi:hypothetical protein